MGIKLYIGRGVKNDVRFAVIKSVNYLRKCGRVCHRLDITVVKNEFVSADDEFMGFGVFSNPKGYLKIHIAAGLADICHHAGDPREVAVEAVVHTLFHEFAHYEQWRDGKPMIERGVNLRATNLMKKCGSGHW